MCYGIRELTGKKIRESNIAQRTGSPEMSEHSKIETRVRAWLKKWVHKGSARDKKERPVPYACGALSMLQRLALSLLMVVPLAQAGGCSIHIGGGFHGHGFHGHHGFGFHGLFGHKFIHRQ
jgi:sensor domain CHASE-containing protein